MMSAKYGRMNMGRCVVKDYGSQGCQTDVLYAVHSYCSGRRACSFAVSVLHELNRKSVNSCPAGLISYLEANYECIPVAPCSATSCKSGSYLKVPVEDSPNGYIAGITTAETGCGSHSCPWVIEPQDGQLVSLKFFFFQGPDVSSSSYCHKHATVLDQGTRVSKDITVCNGGPGITQVNISQSAAAEIKVYTSQIETESHMVISYEIIGCSNIKAPSGATMKRNGDMLTVACEKSMRSWHLTCNGNSWVGEVGRCDTGGKTAAWRDKDGTTPKDLVVVVGIGVALGVLLGFSFLGLAVYCMRRNRSSHYQRPDDIVRYPTEAGKGYEIKVYDQSEGTPHKMTATPDSGYYTGTNYQSQPSTMATGSGRQVLPSRYPPPPGGQQGVIPPTYFQAIGSAEGQYKFRDHVYESPNFKQQEDTRSVATSAST